MSFLNFFKNICREGWVLGIYDAQQPSQVIYQGDGGWRLFLWFDGMTDPVKTKCACKLPEKAQTPEYGWYAREKDSATWHPMTDYTNGVDNGVDDWALTLGCGPGNADLSTCHVDYSPEPAKTRQTGHKMNILTNTTIGTVGVSRVNEIDEPYDEICGADTGGSRH